MHSLKTYSLGELFCGPGGLALGAKQAGIVKHGKHYTISHAWATDNDQDACATYRGNICPDRPDTIVCQDIRKLDFKRLDPLKRTYSETGHGGGEYLYH